ncbi:MAG: hypothetical protein RBR67_12420 [Desulfobacterium sp.]|nr:hypothetical protein [Desulfobacterium sp.]
MRSIKIKICLWLVLVGLPLLFYSTPRVQASNTENQCFSCHTNARELIKITREISKSNKDKPGGSAETKGEG